jgi:hypothetical protein
LRDQSNVFDTERVRFTKAWSRAGSGQKKYTTASIFLDTLFREIYTFVSCNESCAAHSLDHRENRQNGNEEGSQESGKEGSKEEVNPTGKRIEGDAYGVPLDALRLASGRRPSG